jgi:hypothetical protein
MPVNAYCTHCNTLHRVSTEVLGKKGKCKSCGKAFVLAVEELVDSELIDEADETPKPKKKAVNSSGVKKKKKRVVVDDDDDDGYMYYSKGQILVFKICSAVMSFLLLVVIALRLGIIDVSSLDKPKTTTVATSIPNFDQSVAPNTKATNTAAFQMPLIKFIPPFGLKGEDYESETEQGAEDVTLSPVEFVNGEYLIRFSLSDKKIGIHQNQKYMAIMINQLVIFSNGKAQSMSIMNLDRKSLEEGILRFKKEALLHAEVSGGKIFVIEQGIKPKRISNVMIMP